MTDEKNAFIATARKYRPPKFADILAQPGVTVTLKNALARNRVHHAYLFCGPRGTGKTTTARVLAKALNCTDLQDGDPCGTCDECVSFQTGRSMDIIEIDGASNRGVDDIRNLRERVAYAAAGGGYKVYIVDEVHMLTNEAFNALLKTLEEPPPKVAFIFATTEPAKVPATILSRCQRFDFRRIGPEPVKEALLNIVKSEGIEIETEVLELISRRATGSLRDAFSLLDQVTSFGTGKITRAMAEEALGVISEESLFEFSGFWAERATEKAFAHLGAQWEAGVDPGDWTQAFGEHLRSLLAAKVGGVASPGERFDAACEPFQMGDLLRAQVMLSDLKLRLRLLTDPRPEVELFILRLFTLADTVNLAQVVSGTAVQRNRPPATSRPAHAPRSENVPPPAGPNPADEARSDEFSPSAELPVSPPSNDPSLELKGSSHDSELPKEPFQKFLVLLRRRAPWAAAELRKGSLEEHDHRSARFFVPESNSFNQSRFTTDGIRAAVAGAFKEVWGTEPRIEFRFGAGERAPADTKSLVENNPALADLIEATGGEILARRPRNDEG